MSFKRILSTALATLIFYVASAQQPVGSYNAAFKKIDSLLQKAGLPNSALTEANKIYARAKKEKNNAQLIKSLIYISFIQLSKEEDAPLKNIQLWEKEIPTAAEPARSIMQSITATMYWTYFQNNRWRLYNRTETVNFKKDDVATWSINDFHKKITELYLASLSKEKLLQETKLEPFDPIIEKGINRHLRPTLYDLLAHRALDYFRSSEPNVTKPAYAFEISNAAAFEDAAGFVNATFDTRDTVSPNYRALQLYQRIIRFHLNDAKPDALIDIDLNRLQFMHDHNVVEHGDSLYAKALERVANKYGDLPIAARVWHALASWYFEKAQQYDAVENPADRYAYLQAKAICERVVAQKDSSEGKANCQYLLNEILRQEVSLETEKINVPGQPFRTLVRWRNFTQLNFRIIKIDANTREKLNSDNNDNDDFWKKLLALPVLKSFTRSLPDTRDHQMHRAEIGIDSLPIGQYALVASVNNKFSIDKNRLSVQIFHISNIAWIQKEQEFFVLNRSTGQPLVRANVQVWYPFYNANTRRNEQRKGENIFTDKNGHFVISRPRSYNENNNYKLDVSYNGDRLMLDDYLYSYPRSNTDKKEVKQTFMFTDRSLYRPGQIVYVKGIVINRPSDNAKSTVVPDFKTTLYIFDTNGQKRDSILVTSNEFGSYSARFNLPAGLLNGYFTLRDKDYTGSAAFRVEEYKRPRFLTEIAQPAGTYRLNDTIKVTGTAKAYAGNNIDGALVKYRVTRRVIMPMWRYSFSYSKMIWPPQGNQQVEIAHGETTTDASGNFIIAFKALPDNKIAKKDQPTFHYEVHADVTDNTGETRSATTSVSVAYQALQLNLDIPQTLHKDSLKTIKLSSTNLAGTFEKATVNVTMHRLLPPARLLRDRLWQQPDTFTMSREEYTRLFPYDIYADENDPAKWARGQKVMDITDTTSSNSKFNTQNPKLTVGWYVVEATTKDKYGEDVKALSYVQLYDQQIAGPMTAVTLNANQSTLQPGDKLSYTIATNADSAYVIHELIKKDDQEEESIVVLNKNIRSFEIPVTENERGGMAISIIMVKNNRVYEQTEMFSIPYTNKELKVSYATYRDKTLPGSQEKWTVTISGYKGEKVAAELLTGMYDASLDQFNPHGWSVPSLWNYLSLDQSWNGALNFTTVNSMENEIEFPEVPYSTHYDRLIIDGDFANVGRIGMRLENKARGVRIRGITEKNLSFDAAAPAPVAQGEMFTTAEAVLKQMPGVVADTSGEIRMPQEGQAQVRKNFNETAFFFPDLKTDADGNITFSFTMPEAVTQWKWMSLAHTKDLAFGYEVKNIVTQKDLMVQPNAPRFMREGDRMDFSAKIANITDKELTGQVELQLIDPATGTSVDGWFQNMFPNQFFTVPAGQSVPVKFTIEIPFKYNHPVTYKVIARAGNISDGEEATLPIVSNRMLVTESMPLPLRGQASKSFRFEKLLQSGNSETLNHHALTVEFTSNPAWYAVQALPYLMEYPYECSEQLFNRYYANALASTIANASPRVKEIFERWKTLDTAALMSNLQKNQELKMVLLEETPWVLQAKSESEQKRNIALLFDMVRMNSELKASLTKLKDLQLSNGGFAWFKGGRDDLFITQYILTGIGHLKKLNALPANDATLNNIIRTAMPYLDARLKETYDELLRANKGQEPAKGSIGYYETQYLYMRSFFTNMDIAAKTQKAYAYYRKLAQTQWVTKNRYMQGMLALAMHRTNAATTAKSIMASLKQNALFSEEMGMYWAQPSGYYWYQAPIETQALLIEAFTEVTADSKSVADMKTWLLKQKQTQNWRTTKATADACYALLLQGKDWLSYTPEVSIQLGNYTIRSTEQPAEAGTGYFKKTIDGKSVQPEMGNVQVFVKAQNGKEAQPSWGAVYWQYFEALDKITPAETPLKLSKKLFVEKNTDRGPVLQPVNEGDELKVGDKIKVRIELRADRAMEYVHMKDMRAACLEPVNVLSSFKWQGGLGYYESTKDASTNFFFSYLPKGTFVFEYALFVTHTGTFSNGITSIQCMYAPEFGSHSEGIKIRVE
jgi:uncharacterized protein YfaS (alpha-2-macroglobulin family)